MSVTYLEFIQYSIDNTHNSMSRGRERERERERPNTPICCGGQIAFNEGIFLKG